MKEVFLIIISLVGVVYAFWTKQTRPAFGFLILAMSFALIIPGLAEGIMTDILGAISLVLFLVSVFLIIWKKKEA